ncbi:MAG TPA: hypothetical protein ENJ84_09990 [Gammaproteobacteria bacterium]|nr:hypothetical protein [Gammaproteobacteria bacterium]
MTVQKQLLFINEYGIYPELIAQLKKTGYDITVEHLMRKALKFIKKYSPDIVVAEFVHEAQFRDRVSNLESLLAQIEGKNMATRTLVLYEPSRQEYLDRVRGMFHIDAVLPHPIDAQQLLDKISELS